VVQEDGAPSITSDAPIAASSPRSDSTGAQSNLDFGIAAARATLVAPKEGSISTRLQQLTLHNGTTDEPAVVDMPGHRLMPGDLIGPYRVLEHLGSGGMGYLHRARDERLERDVAIKLAFDSGTTDSGAILREARALAALNHPNVVTIYEVGLHGDYTYIAMELLRGETLRARIDRAPIPLQDALAWACDIIRGLSASHKANLLHLDIKPENIFLTKEGPAKLIDYGVARQRRTDAYESDNIVGTIAYMAPEQLIGDKLDYRADIFSFGVILHELTTGKHPFMRPQLSATMHALVTGDFFNDEHQVDPLVDAIVRKCMQLEPAQRPATAAEVLEELERILRIRSQTVSNPIPASPEPKEVKRAAQWLPLAAALVVLGGALYLAMGKPSAPISTPAPAASMAVPPKSYLLVLESQPSGASVREGSRELGKTPLKIDLASNGTSTRNFTLFLDGYSPYSFGQEPTTADVHFIAQLSKIETPAASSSVAEPESSGPVAMHKKVPPVIAKSAAPAPSPAPRPANTLDIKLTR